MLCPLVGWCSCQLPRKVTGWQAGGASAECAHDARSCLLSSATLTRSFMQQLHNRMAERCHRATATTVQLRASLSRSCQAGSQECRNHWNVGTQLDELKPQQGICLCFQVALAERQLWGLVCTPGAARRAANRPCLGQPALLRHATCWSQQDRSDVLRWCCGRKLPETGPVAAVTWPTTLSGSQECGGPHPLLLQDDTKSVRKALVELLAYYGGSNLRIRACYFPPGRTWKP